MTNGRVDAAGLIELNQSILGSTCKISKAKSRDKWLTGRKVLTITGLFSLLCKEFLKINNKIEPISKTGQIILTDWSQKGNTNDS